MTLTDWYPCTTTPLRDGWYEVQRCLFQGGDFSYSLVPVERVRFQGGSWDRHSSESKTAVWASHDYWRGVTEDSMPCNGKKPCDRERCIWPQCKPNELYWKLRGVTEESK